MKKRRYIWCVIITAYMLIAVCIASLVGKEDNRTFEEKYADILAKEGEWQDYAEAGFTCIVKQIDSENMLAAEQLAELRNVSNDFVEGSNEDLLDENAYSDVNTECDSLDENSDEDEYSNFAIANVDKYVNVRNSPNTDAEIVGRMYDGSVAQIQSEVEGDNGDGKWLEVISGNLSGYIKAEYFIYGNDAVKVIDEYVDRYALVKADCLNIRENPNVESKRIGYALNGEKLRIESSETIEAENGDSTKWLKVHYAEDKTGYVSAEYADIREEFIYAKTMEEIRAKEAEEKALLARQKEDEKKKPENVQIVATAPAEPVSTPNYSASGNIRSDVVNFAMQYVGYPYVHGGNSLATGTDCSGFTSLVYAQFGYGLSRTPGGQLSSNGRSISLDQAQPGDIICYGKGSKCTHVALYIGGGQIVHAANPRKGVVVYNVGYDNIIGVKNVID